MNKTTDSASTRIIPRTYVYLILPVCALATIVPAFMSLSHPSLIWWCQRFLLTCLLGSAVSGLFKVRFQTHSNFTNPIYPVFLVTGFFAILPVAAVRFQYNQITVSLAAIVSIAFFGFAVIRKDIVTTSSRYPWAERVLGSTVPGFLALLFLSSFNKLLDFDVPKNVPGQIISHKMAYRSSELILKLTNGQTIVTAPSGPTLKEISGKSFPIDAVIFLKPGFFGLEWVWDIKIDKN